MQTSSARTPLRSRRFDSTTGKRRGFWYSWRALAAGLALALLAGSGIAVAAVGSSATAHTPTITYDCQGVHVKAQWYDAADTNTVTVTIDNTTQGPFTFSTDFPDQFFAFPTSTDAWTFTASVNTSNPNPAFSQTVTATSVPCVAPTVNISIDKCTVAGGTLDLTATLGQLDASHSYTIALSSADAGGTNVAATPIPGGFAAPNGSFVFKNVIPGHVYTATIVDTTVNLSGTGTTTSTGCPKDSGIDVRATQCTVAGGTGGFSVTVSNLSFGRDYIVNVVDASNAVVATQTVTGDLSGTATVPFAVTAGGTYKATVTDKLIGAPSTKTSDAKTYLPCPKTPDVPEVDPTQCTSTNGVPNSSISFSASGLVPGRTYQVTVSDGAANVYDSTPFVASASNWPTTVAKQILNIGPGTYTVTVADVTDPALTTFVSSNAATLVTCPKLPELSITPTQCTVPGGTGSIATSVSATSYIPGRTYNLGLTLVQGGGTVVAPAPVVAPANGVWTLPAFSNLAANTQYRVTLTDTVVTSVSAYGDIALAVCPGMPTVVVQAGCNVLGASTANVSLDKLEANQTYTVTITKLSNNTVIGTQTVPGTTPTASLKFSNVPNGNQYMVNVANANNTLTGSASFYLKNCDLPTLAFTGANPVGPAVAGIGFLQFGLMFVGFGLVKRRRRTA